MALIIGNLDKAVHVVGQRSGVYALVVDAKDDEAKRFYERYGFIAFDGYELTLYLPLETALKAL